MLEAGDQTAPAGQVRAVGQTGGFTGCLSPRFLLQLDPDVKGLEEVSRSIRKVAAFCLEAEPGSPCPSVRAAESIVPAPTGSASRYPTTSACMRRGFLSPT